MPALSQRWIGAAALAAGLMLAGCATAPQGATPHPQDPYEGYNRAMFSFNEKVDNAIAKPVAQAYQFTIPQPIRTGVTNFFGNLRDVWSMANHALQGNGEQTYNHMVRVTTNTVFGLGGLLDVATEMQIPRNKQDFGQTLGHWGIKPGPYLVLPLLGPSTVRDTVALPVDWQGNVLGQLNPELHRHLLTGLRIVDTRVQLLGATDTLNAVALDRYSLTRDFFLKQRDAAAAPDDNAGRIESYDD